MLQELQNSRFLSSIKTMDLKAGQTIRTKNFETDSYNPVVKIAKVSKSKVKQKVTVITTENETIVLPFEKYQYVHLMHVMS